MTQIYLHPLDSNASAGKIGTLFEEFGVVAAVRIFVAGLTPKFAIVEMPFEEAAAKAVHSLNGKRIDGREMEVVELGIPE